eukprot:TRINITY_DN2214_c0_g1_i1.p1 TRINITY_DN2214_c0_g1~~TRINITY_DN2214_c0_g1_i1.p1  ORF type:complete len:571 (+),score=75.20 TRINITY_DN2214_c0_g1_i1:176-1888(+)
MTRLVRVRAICDGCSAAAATLFCVSLRHVLCDKCNCIRRRSRHPHVALSSVIIALPFCEYCDLAPATVYCETEGATLCDKCDETIHKAAPLSHCRSPIQNTLQTRAVEFRTRSASRPRKRLTNSQINQRSNLQRATNPLSRPDRTQQLAIAHRTYSRSSRSRVAAKLSPQRQQPIRSPQNNQSQQVAPPLTQKPSATTSSAVATQDHVDSTAPTQSPLTAPTEQTQPVLTFQPACDPPRNHLFHTDEYTPYFESHPTNSNVHMSVDTYPFSSLPTEIADAAKSLCEPLLITEEPNIQPLEMDPLAEPDSSTLDLSNVLSCASIDPSTDDNLPHVNLRPPSPAHAINSLHSSLRRNQTQFSITATAAAAATAAAEMYLLSTASHVTASKAQVTASLKEISRAIDPVGLTTAATAAAESAAAAAEMSSLSSRSPASEMQHRSRLSRHVSEPALPLRAAAQQHVFDEAMRRLDIDLVKHRKREDGQFANGKLQFGAADGPNQAMPSAHDYTNHELGRSHAIEYPDTQREAFSPFGSLPLSQFDQNQSSCLEFEQKSVLDSRGDFCRAPDSDNR